MSPTDLGPSVAARRRLAVVLLAALLTAGCSSLVDGGDEAPDDDPPPGEERVEDCIAQTFEGNASRGAGQAAHLECRANVAGRNEAGVDCPDPDEASLTVQTNLTDGRLRLVVTDGDDETVLDRRFADTGGQPRNVSMDTGNAVPGEWTLAGERNEAFDGTYRAELFCSAG